MLKNKLSMQCNKGYRTEEKLGGKTLWRIDKNSPKLFSPTFKVITSTFLQHASTSPNFLSAKIPIVGFAKFFYRQVFLPYGNSLKFSSSQHFRHLTFTKDFLTQILNASICLSFFPTRIFCYTVYYCYTLCVYVCTCMCTYHGAQNTKCCSNFREILSVWLYKLLFL